MPTTTRNIKASVRFIPLQDFDIELDGVLSNGTDRVWRVACGKKTNEHKKTERLYCQSASTNELPRRNLKALFRRMPSESICILIRIHMSAQLIKNRSNAWLFRFRCRGSWWCFSAAWGNEFAFKPNWISTYFRLFCCWLLPENNFTVNK